MIYKNFNFLEKSFGAQHSKIELGLIIPSFFQFCCQRKDIISKYTYVRQDKYLKN